MTSLARAKTRNATNARPPITIAFLAFLLAMPISGVRNAINKGTAIIKIEECPIRVAKLLSFHPSRFF